MEKLYKNIESILYATIVFFVSSKTIDFVLYGSDRGKMMMIISSKSLRKRKTKTGLNVRSFYILWQ